MKVADFSTGDDMVVWILIIVLVIVSLVLLSGHGSGLIAGYNTLTDEEQSKYDKKRICRVFGVGMLIITILLLVTLLMETILPAFFLYVVGGIVIVDVIGMAIFMNIYGKIKYLLCER